MKSTENVRQTERLCLQNMMIGKETSAEYGEDGICDCKGNWYFVNELSSVGVRQLISESLCTPALHLLAP